MREDIDRVLVYLGRITGRIPTLQMIVGYLLSDPSRVRFVDALGPGPELTMVISAHRRIELPVSPWQGYIRGVPVPDALMWIQAARTMPGQISVRLTSDDPILVQMLTPLLMPERERQERRLMDERMQSLREELDRTLDLYNEVRHIMAIDSDRHQEMEQFLGMAEQEMQNLSRELGQLKQRIEENGSHG